MTEETVVSGDDLAVAFDDTGVSALVSRPWGSRYPRLPDEGLRRCQASSAGDEGEGVGGATFRTAPGPQLSESEGLKPARCHRESRIWSAVACL